MKPITRNWEYQTQGNLRWIEHFCLTFGREFETDENIDEHDVEESFVVSYKRSKTSVVWEDFEKLPLSSDGKQRAKCRICRRELISNSRGGASSMLRHITDHKLYSDNPSPPCSNPLE